MKFFGTKYSAEKTKVDPQTYLIWENDDKLIAVRLKIKLDED